jgi:hypothetical protein
MAYKRKRGVPTGYKHIWGYRGVWKERKGKYGVWKIDFKATKGKKAKGYGSFKRGFAIKWRINAIQTAVKTGPGRYETHMVGTKKQIKSKTFKKRKYNKRTY